jgi:hypothetical protein
LAEGARIAAGHPPGDLVAGPGLDDVAVVRVDDDLDELLATREEADLPKTRPRVAAGGRTQVRVLLGRRHSLGVEFADFDRLRLRDPRLLGAGGARQQHDQDER